MSSAIVKDNDIFEQICIICGVSAIHRNYILTQDLSTAAKKQLAWFLTPKICLYFDNKNSICTICIQKIENTIEMIQNMRSNCLLTTITLKAYYKNPFKTNWSDFNKSETVGELLRNDNISNMLKEIRCITSETTNAENKVQRNLPDRVNVDLDENMYDDDCTNFEWLSDVESENSHCKLNNIQEGSFKFGKVDENDKDATYDKTISCVNMKEKLKYRFDKIDKKCIVNGYELNTKGSNVKPISVDKTIRINKRGYIYATNAQDHILRENDGLYKCVFCTKKFKFQYKAELHVRSNHTQERPFACVVCLKQFTASHYLKRHISEVHKERKFSCEMCDRTFIRKYELATHKKTHASQPQLSCSNIGCTKKFYSELSMKKHFINSHADKTLICDECGKGFRTKFFLTKHIRYHIKISKVKEK